MKSNLVKKNDYWTSVHDDMLEYNPYYKSIKESYEKSFLANDTIYLLHSTTESNYSKILNQQSLYPSAGCLVGGVYSTPLIQENGMLRVHNLGSYYSIHEIPKIIKKRSLDDECVKNLIIEIKGYNKRKMKGINYLQMGKIHYNYFEKYKFLINQNIAKEILDKVNNILLNSKTFLIETSKLSNKKLTLDESKCYLNDFGKQMSEVPIWGYVLFEALSEFIILNQNDFISNLYKQKNELYNWNYKNIFFELYPFLLTKFNLEDIKFDLDHISDKVKKSEIIYNFNCDNFTISLCSTILKIINTNIIGKVWESDFNKLPTGVNLTYSDNLIPLVGHIIHKVTKKTDCQEFYEFIEQIKAIDVWEYWGKDGSLIVYNNLIPKGEFGINPVLINQYNYKIYQCDKFIKKNNFYYVDEYKPINIKIKPKLINYNRSLLR